MDSWRFSCIYGVLNDIWRNIHAVQSELLHLFPKRDFVTKPYCPLLAGFTRFLSEENYKNPAIIIVDIYTLSKVSLPFPIIFIWFMFYLLIVVYNANCTMFCRRVGNSSDRLGVFDIYHYSRKPDQRTSCIRRKFFMLVPS